MEGFTGDRCRHGLSLRLITPTHNNADVVCIFSSPSALNITLQNNVKYTEWQCLSPQQCPDANADEANASEET
jgi:hypothetical protein